MHLLPYKCFGTHLIVCCMAGVLFTGRGKPVADENGTPLKLNNGQPRLGKGLAESTFRKIYHGLRTLHTHFQNRTEYKACQVLCYI